MTNSPIRATALLVSFSMLGCAADVDSGVDQAELPGQVTQAETLVTADCIPSCDGRQCGKDPVCGASCGTCSDGQSCDASTGQCQATCVPDCSERSCGLDPICGTSCGTCGDGQSCNETSGQCQAACVPDCGGRTCGADPVCGTSCGTCSDGQVCDNALGQCQTACVPDCSGRTCGADPKCGTSCGTCTDGSECSTSGICLGNHAPVAVAASPKTAICDATTGSGRVALDGSLSSDQDGDSLQYAWTEGTTILATTSVATAALSVGTHAITLTVTDTTGLKASATTSVTVGKSAPVFTSSLAAVAVSTCSADAATALPLPTALDRCASGAIKISGKVISTNGKFVSVPIVAGSAVLPAGTSIVRWTASADGLTTVADQTVNIMERWGLLATRRLTIADGAQILRASGGYGLVVNVGTTATSLGVEAKVGSILSAAPVTLGDRAQVFGSVRTASTLTRFNGVWIRDTVSERAMTVFPSVPGVPTTTPRSTTDVILQPDRVQTISAGTYRSVSVASRSTLRIRAGVYYVDSLDLEPQATLSLDGSGSVQLYVRSRLVFRGSISDPKSTTANAQIVYLGTSPAYLESPFSGSLLAPNSSVTLRSTALSHSGAFFARDLLVDAHATVSVRPNGC